MLDLTKLSPEELSSCGVEKLLQAMLHRLGTQNPLELSQVPTERIEAELALRNDAHYVAAQDSRWRKLLNETGRYFNISAASLLADDRTRLASDARHIFYYVAYHSLGFGYTNLGRKVRRDHTSIRYGVLRIKDVLEAGGYRADSFGEAIRVITAFANDLVIESNSISVAVRVPASVPTCLARLS